MSSIRIEVAAAARRYAVTIADGASERLGALLDEAGVGRQRVIVSSPTVWRLHRHAMAASVPDLEPILIPDGERFKTLATAGRIYESLIRAGADRLACLIAVGGGVVGDVAGFAAATYLRGIAHVQVPTTLLAQVDSAIGGKVGVNHQLGKNLIGAFHPPSAVVIDPRLLRTLPRREFRAGLYEVVKYGVIADAELFRRLESRLAALFDRQPDVLVPVVADCCRIKADVVTADERESGLRRVLNFGHTVGHALEAITRYRRFRHGEAIAYGMLAAGRLARARATLAASEFDRLAALLVKMGPLPPVADLPIEQAMEAVRRDKKILAGRLHVVLPTAIGSVAIVDDVEEREIEDALGQIGLRGT